VAVTHSHRATPATAVAVSDRVRLVLLAVLVLAGLATVVGVVRLWPDRSALDQVRARAPYAAPGVTTPDARVDEVAPRCPASKDGSTAQNAPGGCGTLRVSVLEGAGRGDATRISVPPEVSEAGLRPGDHVELFRTPARDGQPVSYSFSSVRRTTPLLWLTVLFVLVVVLVARWRGLMALVGLAVGALTLYLFLLPALLAGEPALPVAAVSASAIMFVVLYGTHGVSLRTSTALAGTLCGIALTAVLGMVVIGQARLTGISDESGGMLSSFAGDLDFQGLLACSMLLAGLGVLNDVTITQASAVWELRAASPEMGRRRVFAGAMRIGRDHIASTIYTIVFAYAGAALIVLMLLAVYDRPVMDLISSEALAEEIARTLTSAVGLVLAVPVTTAVAALVASRSGPAADLEAGDRVGAVTRP
jgi:uncharacterized membrane protein